MLRCSSLTSSPSPLPPALQCLLAIILLFLLEAAFCELKEFTWGGPDGSTGSVDPNTENGEWTYQLTKLHGGFFLRFFSNIAHLLRLCVCPVCLTDQASCGCCLMQQQIHRMKRFFNASLGALEAELAKTKAILNNVRGEARPVATCATQFCLFFYTAL